VSGCSLVFHGPDVIDSGEATRLVAALGPARVVVAGIMARCGAGLLVLRATADRDDRPIDREAFVGRALSVLRSRVRAVR